MQWHRNAPEKRRAGSFRGGMMAAAMVFAAATAGSPAPVVAAEQWQAYTYWGSPNVVAARGFRKLTEDIQAASEGALSVKFNLGGSLSIAASNINSAVGDDIVQLAHDAYFQGAIPGAGLLSLPFLIRDIGEMKKAVEIMRPYVETGYGKRGVTVLGYYIYPPQVFWSRGAVASLDDIKGRKYRVTSPEQSDFVKAFGGLPVNIGSADVPAALERGVVDGVLTASAGGILAWKELLKSSYRVEVNFPVSWIIVNTERFKALSPAVQARIKALTESDTDTLTAELQRDDATLTKQVSETGITVLQPKPADVEAAQARMIPLWGDWAKARGPEVVGLLQQVRAALSR